MRDSCVPTGACRCIGHVMPGVSHIVCCDQPHVGHAVYFGPPDLPEGYQPPAAILTCIGDHVMVERPMAYRNERLVVRFCANCGLVETTVVLTADA